MENESDTRSYRVSGRVQGVGFRWSAHVTAQEFDLAGWVRNAADGTVEILASGTQDQLREFESWLEKGPRFARVDLVEKLHVERNMDLTKPFSIT